MALFKDGRIPIMLRSILPLSIGVALSAVPAIAQAAGPLHAYSSLDYSREHASGSIVFLPYLSSDTSYELGITFYTSYYNDVQAPQTLGSAVRSVEVYVVPTAHRGDEAEYNDFFTNTSRVDAMEYWFSSSNPCSLSADLATYTNGFPPNLQPIVRTAGYPQTCYAKIFYRTAQEASLLALLNSNRGIILQDQLPFCASTSPVFKTKPVVSALETAGVLVDDGNGSVTGTWGKVLKELSKLGQHQPSLFGGAATASDGENVFLRDALDYIQPNLATLISGYEDTSMTACIPAPLTISYGQ
jgi:hypothetical protein